MNIFQRLSFTSRARAASISDAASRSRAFTLSSPPLTPHKSVQRCQLHRLSQPEWQLTKRHLSTITHGQDLLADSLSHGPRRKIILESYGPSGFDVKGMIRVGDHPVDGEGTGDDALIHINGSIVVFPHACFLWNVTSPKEITLESLSVVKLYKPTIEYLFIGCESPMPPRELNRIKKEFRKGENHIIAEQMDVMNAMGTFNILNGEDRRVACVLVLSGEDV
ncbi:hypothetical protein HJC23_009637 [Cyclotella cryptica]|uniref:NADH dehydrogenase [ubiquinone] 1 alpha subcomplex assembly factor 3 n=1 Tax=Cyclotella cryptica TaxID=29204 RepID=A0ABD3PVH9_9STRA|eukprot:CCRYP_010904-RA/>CCRYP_010904-RA protein AED:0.37 eAED:0.37 QI:0/-1/0/1/-1/1/1/0/221